MKKASLYLCVLAAALCASCAKNEIADNKTSLGDSAPSVSTEPDVKLMENAMFHEGLAIVRFSEEMTGAIERGTVAKEISGQAVKIGMKIVERVFPHAGEFEERTRREGLHRFYLVEFDHDLTYQKASSVISSISGVENVEPCRKARIAKVNDPLLKDLWGFSGSYSIHAQEAWSYTVGNPDVVVCVVDEGIQQDHPDLQWNLYSDNYNFVRRNTKINAGDHGTHVSGTIAGVSNNGVGVAGIAGGDYAAGRRGVSLQSAEVFEGSYSASNFGTAIKWGADHGAVISQNSWGYDFDWNNDGRITGSELDAALSAEVSASDAAAIEYFTKYAGCDNDGNQLPGSPMKGGLVIFAAGNDGLENGVPGKHPDAIAVGAVNSAGSVAYFSNWGDWVDICAPGQSIKSTVTGGMYDFMSGTSMACPHVSGACALLVSFFGGDGFTNEDLREILIDGANKNLINTGSTPVGPYLDLTGSLEYGINKLKRENNNDPEISTDYDGDFVFRQYQNVSIPFHITDPDGDKVSVTAELGGLGELVQDSDDPETWYLTIIGRDVRDYSTKNASIKATDAYGGEAIYDFRIQVLKNNAPKVVRNIKDMIITGIGTQQKVSLAGLFTDEDGETLKLTAKDAVNNAPAILRVDGESMTLTSVGYGSSSITVTATDGLYTKATTKFRYIVRAADVDMEFYPNPVRDYLNIRTGAELQDAEIVINGPTGNNIFHETIACSAFEPVQIDMREYAPGIYTLRVTTGGKTYVNNVVKR